MSKCEICGGIDEGNTCCDDRTVLTEEYVEATYPTAYAMLALWDMPWSTRRLRYATWALHRARRAGCDVLENPRVMESMEMVAAGGPL
jgi:hypothetical protein